MHTMAVDGVELVRVQHREPWLSALLLGRAVDNHGYGAVLTELKSRALKSSIVTPDAKPVEDAFDAASKGVDALHDDDYRSDTDDDDEEFKRLQAEHAKAIARAQASSSNASKPRGGPRLRLLSLDAGDIRCCMYKATLYVDSDPTSIGLLLQFYRNNMFVPSAVKRKRLESKAASPLSSQTVSLIGESPSSDAPSCEALPGETAKPSFVKQGLCAMDKGRVYPLHDGDKTGWRVGYYDADQQRRWFRRGLTVVNRTSKESIQNELKQKLDWARLIFNKLDASAHKYAFTCDEVARIQSEMRRAGVNI